MIYHYPTRTLIVTPPKTGSSSLHHALCTQRGFYYVLAMAQWGRVSKHCSLDELGNEPPEFSEVHDRRTVLTVRHPTRRLISMYRHHLGYGEFSGCFEKWVEAREHDGGGVKWLRSCHSHLCGRKADGVIHTETLDQDLGLLGLPPTRKRINQARVADDADINLAAEVARTWWPDDFVYYDDQLPQAASPNASVPEGEVP